MNPRNEATATGKLTYNTGKPCRRGHMSDRYTSSGTCITCLQKSNDDRLDALKTARAVKNKAMFEGLRPFPVYVRPSQQHDVSAYCDVLRYGSPEIIEQCNAFIALMREQAIATFGK